MYKYLCRLSSIEKEIIRIKTNGNEEDIYSVNKHSSSSMAPNGLCMPGEEDREGARNVKKGKKDKKERKEKREKKEKKEKKGKKEKREKK